MKLILGFLFLLKKIESETDAFVEVRLYCDGIVFEIERRTADKVFTLTQTISKLELEDARYFEGVIIDRMIARWNKEAPHPVDN